MGDSENELTKLKARLVFPKGFQLPYWLGNKFRGGFGSVLRKAICGYLNPDCLDCRQRNDCLYYDMYEKEKQKRGYGKPVRPIIFIPPFFGKSLTVEKDGFLNLDILMFGYYDRYLPHLIYGLRFLGKLGLNKFSKYYIEVVECVGKKVYDGETIIVENLRKINLGNVDYTKYRGVKKLKILFRTPIDLEKEEISLEFLLKMIRKRLILFTNEYGAGKIPDFLCESRTLTQKLNSHKLPHISKRHGKRTFRGYTGYFEAEVEHMDDFAVNLLAIGEEIGAGSKSSYGMGFFRVESENG
jgi:CRISPR/Cas system endoribonuclease Cas6 (RAMP superfamily)